MNKILNFYDLNFNDISLWLSENNFSSSHHSKIYQNVYLNKCFNLPQKIMTKLDEDFNFDLPKIKTTQVAEDGTVKFLIELFDDKKIESVLIPHVQKYTVCLSSQVGCAMKCSFCYTGMQGLSRDLYSHEIIGQYLVVRNWLWQNTEWRKNPRVVFMGQGEPLHNFENLKKSISILTEKHGLCLGKNHITVSTSGYLPGILRFNELGGVNIALSLHSMRDDIRSALIPINHKYKLKDVLEAIKSIPKGNRQFVMYEYLLIDELNNKDEDIELLSELNQNFPGIINLIPYNPIPGLSYQRPSLDEVESFKSKLAKKGVRTFIRSTKGDEILAACGQLNSNIN